ncbi:energy transducer TonB [Tenacibaculum sp. ZS6-P6]|uniref:energy transducer TonB n=1 Tax=Tenacibaculum sp. ZS6-P6 TaxID=3447503 RepID=UPI003F9A6CD2
MKNYKITIPEPCHENWQKMTPNEKGRFCASCSKTVVDFTKKSTKEIQEYLTENKGKRVCGHFYRKQLDSIVIQLPDTVFNTNLSFQKLFFLALFIAMGTTLFSCKTEQKTQKIEKVMLIDSITKIEKTIDSLTVFNPKDSAMKTSCETKTVTNEEVPVVGGLPKPEEIEIVEEGEVIVEVMGDIIEEEVIDIGGVPIVENYVERRDGIEPVMGDLITEEKKVQEFHSFRFVDKQPRFKGVVKRANETWEKNFERKMNEFVTKNFDFSTIENLGLSEGKKKMLTQITIDSLGNVSKIETRAPHPLLKEELKKQFEKLPRFIPGKHNGKNVSVRYIIPITFMVE